MSSPSPQAERANVWSPAAGTIYQKNNKTDIMSSPSPQAERANIWSPAAESIYSDVFPQLSDRNP